MFSCKRTSVTEVQTKKELSNDPAELSARQNPMENHDSADLINYVVSFSNLCNREIFHEYYLSVKDEIQRYTPDSNEIDPNLTNGILQIADNDQDYQSELLQFEEATQQIEQTYNISNFTREDWEKVMRSAHKADIYLFPDAKKKN